MHPAQDTSALLILLESSESQLYRGASHFCRWMTKADMTSDSKVEKNAKNFLTQ